MDNLRYACLEASDEGLPNNLGFPRPVLES